MLATCRAAAVFLIGVSTLAQAAAPAGEDPQTRRAREELERQLGQLVKKHPAAVRITFEGVDKEGYELVEASFALDGKPLPAPPPKELLTSRRPLVEGALPPGQHVFTAKLKVHSSETGLFTYVRDYKFNVQGKVTFRAQRGVLMNVITRVRVNPAAIDPQQRLKFVAEVKPKQVANWDDVNVAELSNPRKPADGTQVASAKQATTVAGPTQAAADEERAAAGGAPAAAGATPAGTEVALASGTDGDGKGQTVGASAPGPASATGKPGGATAPGRPGSAGSSGGTGAVAAAAGGTGVAATAGAGTASTPTAAGAVSGTGGGRSSSCYALGGGVLVLLALAALLRARRRRPETKK